MAAFIIALPLAQAKSAPDPYKLALDAFDHAGIVPLSEDEKKFAATFIKCMVDGNNILDCGARQVEGLLPEKAAQFSRCMREELKDAAACGKKVALDAAQQKQAEATEKLKNQGRLGDIVNTVQGLINEDWEKVIISGGKTVAKFALCAVTAGLMSPGPHAGITCDILGFAIDAGGQAVKDLVNAIKAEDWLEVVKVAYKFVTIDMACSLLPGEAGEVKEFICGGLGKILDGIKEGAGTVLGPVLGLIEDVVGKAIEVFGDALKSIGCVFGVGKCGKCLPPAQLYADNFINCFHRAAYLGLESNQAEGKKRTDALHSSCFQHYKECMDDKDARNICNGLVKLFNDQTATLVNAMNESAQSFARSQRSAMEARRTKLCAPGEFDAYGNQFVGSCESKMLERFPFPGANTPDCRPIYSTGQFPSFGGGTTAYSAACGKAKDGAYKSVYGDVCAGAGVCFATETEPPSVIK